MAAEILLLGSRAGALAVFTDINDRIAFASPTICRRRVHGQDTVTSIAVLKEAPNSSNDELFFLTTGRDGTCCALQLDLGRFDKKNDKKTPAHIRIVHQATPPLGPNIEGAKVINRSGTVPKLLLYGFSSKQFVVWDEMNQTQVMAVACGGAHRSWHFRPDESTSDAGTFVWTQAGTFMSYQQTEADHKVIQPGGHGREIKALAVHYTGGSKWLVATGSEDTDIRLFEYMDDEGEPNLKSIAVIRKHTTGLQDLHFSPDGSTLISAAGMEEMFSWHLSPIPVLRQGVVFAGALPRTDEQSDARIMSFDVMPQEGGPGDNSLLIVAAFSNGKVKTIQYSPEAYTEAATFTVLHQLDLGTICLTQAHFLPTSTTDVSRALIGATNGFLTATPTSDQKSSPFVSSPTTTSHKVHQNSITAMAATNLTPNHTLITTGGDDNSLALTITHDPSNLPPTITTKPRFQTLTIPKAHAAALTALAVIEVAVPDSAIDSGSPFQNKHFLLITAGNDQIVASWHVKVDTAALRAVEAATADSAGLGTGTAGEAGQDLEHLHITLLEEKYTNVADISGIAILQKDPSGIVDHDIRSVQVMIVGVGMEVLEVEVPRLEGV
ncbi:WD repeat-containing protein 6 [Knufia obscura]|uniref:WD repeat-containing protein 6 n=2 Tax=Knufia TaxID=430999 RepID=A0AAN8I836_9EURO|nr:WD repeat-containing protein 6 [Knufia obscura]KAK5952670.1 WD repeat-containing protein 6 [Knufia fluminis]